MHPAPFPEWLTGLSELMDEVDPLAMLIRWVSRRHQG